MSQDFLNDNALRGPHDTRRIPQVFDLVPHARLQEKPIYELSEDRMRWTLSPYMWQFHNMGVRQVAGARAAHDDRSLEALINQNARHYDAQADLLRQLLDAHQTLARQMLMNMEGTPGPAPTPTPTPVTRPTFLPFTLPWSRPTPPPQDSFFDADEGEVDELAELIGAMGPPTPAPPGSMPGSSGDAAAVPVDLTDTRAPPAPPAPPPAQAHPFEERSPPHWRSW